MKKWQIIVGLFVVGLALVAARIWCPLCIAPLEQAQTNLESEMNPPSVSGTAQ